jgi:hypothetical protein
MRQHHTQRGATAPAAALPMRSSPTAAAACAGRPAAWGRAASASTVLTAVPGPCADLSAACTGCVAAGCAAAEEECQLICSTGRAVGAKRSRPAQHSPNAVRGLLPGSCNILRACMAAATYDTHHACCQHKQHSHTLSHTCSLRFNHSPNLNLAHCCALLAGQPIKTAVEGCPYQAHRATS